MGVRTKQGHVQLGEKTTFLFGAEPLEAATVMSSLLILIFVGILKDGALTAVTVDEGDATSLRPDSQGLIRAAKC